MITVVIGGDNHLNDEEGVFNSLHCKLNKPPVLFASKNEFPAFYRHILRSTNTLKLRVGMSDSYTEQVANDDVVFFFDTKYLVQLEGKMPMMCRLATIFQTAIDLGLDIQAFSFSGYSSIWNPSKMQWPADWPSILHYTNNKENNNGN